MKILIHLYDFVFNVVAEFWPFNNSSEIFVRLIFLKYASSFTDDNKILFRTQLIHCETVQISIGLSIYKSRGTNKRTAHVSHQPQYLNDCLSFYDWWHRFPKFIRESHNDDIYLVISWSRRLAIIRLRCKSEKSTDKSLLRMPTEDHTHSNCPAQDLIFKQELKSLRSISQKEKKML